MNQKELIITVSNLTGLPRQAVADVLQTAGDVVAEILHEGEEAVRVPGFGGFKAICRKPRRIRLPSGQEYWSVGRKAARWVPGQTFRDRLSGRI